MLNRQVLFEAIARLAPPQASGAILIVRMERLRDFESVFGYAASEALSQAFEERLRSCLRGVDEAVRIGECDYAVVLPGLRDRNLAVLAAAKVTRAFQSPLEADGRPSRVVVSVGTCMAADAVTADGLCRNADAACLQARNQPDRHASFGGGSQPGVVYEDLYQAITGNRLQVYLQPLFALDSGALCGFESLARWQDPQLGFVSPGLFVTAAEQTGLIESLTRWSINASLRHCAPMFKERGHLRCAINISPIALIAAGFVEQMGAALRIWDFKPEQLMLEVTETAFVDNPELIGQVLTKLREMGMGIAVDDFGTGYSSLSYFRHFHVDELKIDISFVRDMMESPRVCRLVESIINMAHSLDAVTVAEGIEDAAVWNKLRELGCDVGQGYYAGRPAPADQALAQYLTE